jgi:hypothetical protein
MPSAMSHPHRTRPSQSPRRDPAIERGPREVRGARPARDARDGRDGRDGHDVDGAGRRRAQANLQPPTDAWGDERLSRTLWDALDVAAHEDASDSPFPHGFHSWPAGVHPAIPRVLLDVLLPAVGEGVVADPFAGGGTVGLEALLHGRAFVGTDLNPLSRLVGGERCRPRDRLTAAAVEELAQTVTEASKERVREKRPARAPVPPAVAQQYLPHTLMELAGLLEEIDAVADKDARRTLAVCFSAILTKVSQRRGDTDDTRREGDGGKRVGRFIPSERFFDKVAELLDKQVALHEALEGRFGERGPRLAEGVQFLTDDARKLNRHLGKNLAKLIVTSPPYGGTYNYTDHHAHRLAFLGLDDAAFQTGELFPRRQQSDGKAFDQGTFSMLSGLSDALHDDGLAIVVVGDADLDGERVDAARHIEAIAPKVSMAVVAVASAPRPDFLRRGPKDPGRGPRLEHLVALAHRRR